MRKIGEISAIILLLCLSRLAITVPNLQPIGTAALFGGALLGSKYLKYIIPLLALFIGDLVYGAVMGNSFADHLFGPTFLAVYGSFLITVLIGKKVIGSSPKMKNVVFAGVLSSVVFFLVTNFASWADPMYSIYTKDFAGLMQCYLAGLAFYKNEIFGSFFLNSLISNVGFSVLVFGLYGYYQKSVSSQGSIA